MAKEKLNPPVYIRLDEATEAQVRELAKQTDRRVSDQLRWLVKQALETINNQEQHELSN